MNSQLIQKLQYSYAGQHEAHQLPVSLKDSLHLISDFFSNSTANKLSLVFPSKEYTAQWLSIPTVLLLIEADFAQFKEEIFESYKQYKQGEKLILNNKAIVEWVGINQNGVAFKTKGFRKSSGVTITIRLSDVIMLQKAPAQRQALSSIKVVKEALPSRNRTLTRNRTPTEKLLNIDTYGNKEFIKNKICLVSKFKSYDDSIEEISLNHALLPEYFKAGKIDDNGNVDEASPLLISNNLLNLTLYLTSSKTISKIIIDGYSTINERITDFSAIDALKIPTILITDLSEIESFESIGNFGFEFFNFSKEYLHHEPASNHSPFQSFEMKLKKYVSFNFRKEICDNSELEAITQKIHSIEKDDSNNNLNILKISLVQLTNIVSRIANVPSSGETSIFNHKLSSIESHFQQQKRWLGESSKPIEETIPILRSVIEKFSSAPSEKCFRLQELIKANSYDYIICPTEHEAKSLTEYLNSLSYSHTPQVISVADVTDNLLSNKQLKAILTGWPKSNNLNRILSSFLFSDLAVLFYQFENKYFNSLQRRNCGNIENIKATVNKNGVHPGETESKSKGFEELYSTGEIGGTTTEKSFDIVEFELKLDSTQYSKYSAKGNLAESCKAQRVEFENNTFIYATESHKFIVINELIDSAKQNPNIYSKKFEALQSGDVIAFINTDTDVLVELVRRNTKSDELAAVKKWTDLWKTLLREYYATIGNDFKKLVDDLRKYDCKKHEVTIRTWLQDDNRIGPDNDADLISIALLAESELLNENISTVRKAISQMTSWRMKASDLVRDKIKNKLLEIADNSIVNTSIEIKDLGRVEFLKISELKKESEEIDKRFVHRLIPKETI